MNRKYSIAPALVLLGLLVLVATHPANAAAFVKFDGVDGEAMDKDHDKWIEVESVSARMDLAPASVAGSGGTARSSADLAHDTFVLTKTVDKSSAKLSEAVCSGKVFPKVEIHMTASYGGSRATYLKYELTNVRITSYSVGGAAESTDRPMEEIALNFGKVKVTYTEDGGKSKGKGAAQSYNVAQREEVRVTPAARYRSRLETHWEDCRRDNVVTVLDTSMVPHSAEEFVIEGLPGTQTAKIFCDAKGENKDYKDCYSCNSSVPANVPYSEACNWVGFCTDGYNGNSSYCSFP